MRRSHLDARWFLLSFGFVLELAMTIDQLRKNAANCGVLADEASNEPTRRRFLRMQQAWLALIETEAWLDGEVFLQSRQRTAASHLLELLQRNDSHFPIIQTAL